MNKLEEKIKSQSQTIQQLRSLAIWAERCKPHELKQGLLTLADKLEIEQTELLELAKEI